VEPPIDFPTQRSPDAQPHQQVRLCGMILDSDVAPLGTPISRPSLTKSEWQEAGFSGLKLKARAHTGRREVSGRSL
jgi:hypothetical protein